MRWLQGFFEHLFGAHAADAVSRLTVGRPAAEVEREARLEDIDMAVEERRKHRALEELEHQQAMQKLTERERAADVRLKEAGAAKEEVEVKRKEAELGWTAEERTVTREKQRLSGGRSKSEVEEFVERIVRRTKSAGEALRVVDLELKPEWIKQGLGEAEAERNAQALRDGIKALLRTEGR